MKDYCAVIKAVDENVGRLLDYLEQIGEPGQHDHRHTSDQGFFLGEHGWFDKRFMYEECQRTPLLVRYPKAVEAGTRSRALAMNIDLAPTFVEMAGLEVPADMQGRSLKGVLTSGGKDPRSLAHGVYYHYYEYPSWHSVKRHYGIRTADYKLIHFYNDVDEWELYDLKHDPHEMQNVYNDPAYADIRQEPPPGTRKLQTECGDTDPCEQEYEFFQGRTNSDERTRTINNRFGVRATFRPRPKTATDMDRREFLKNFGMDPAGSGGGERSAGLLAPRGCGFAPLTR